MRYRMLLFASACLYYSGLMRLINWLHRQSGRRLIIVNYHRASGGELRRHLVYLRKHFHLQFVDHALEALYTTEKDKSSCKDPRIHLAVTFDDGYVDNYTHAFALACELHIPITIFLISGYIGNGAAFWWFDHLVEKAQVDQVSIDGRTYDLKKLDEQQELAQIIETNVSAKASEDARQTYVHLMSRALSVAVDANADPNEAPVSMLTWEKVQEMQASGWVAFGGHTLHHLTLAALENTDEACKEVAACRSLLQAKLGQSARVFAYPHGGIEHIGAGGVLAAQRAGYRWALTTVPGSNMRGTYPYLLRRVSADSRMHWLLIALMTSGVWDLLSYFNWLVKRIKYHEVMKTMRISRIRVKPHEAVDSE